MDIKFKTEKYKNIDLAALARATLEMICEEMCVPVDTIQQVIFADEEHYDYAIKSIKSTETFTNNEAGMGMGKTISNEVNGTSSIVLRLEYLAAMQKELHPDQTKNFTYWAIHIAAHEIGHAKDNSIRKSVQKISKDMLSADAPGNVATFNTYLVETEFAACLHSAKFTFDSVHEADKQNFRDGTKKNLAIVAKEKAAYDGSGLKLVSLANACLGYYWFILIQFAKIVGTTEGNPNVKLDGIYWEGIDPETVEVLNEFRKDLISWWKLGAPEYGVSEAAFKAWKNLLAIDGYLYFEGNQGWELRFNH